MIGVQLQPVDTWFFRDGTPFTKESAPQENVSSLFPPHPPTVVGALRAALASARGNGWTGQGEWPPGICDVLGDGPENLGLLSFVGPVLLRDNAPLFRAPRHLLGSTDDACWRPRIFLRPGPPVMCDLDDATQIPEVSGTTGEIEKLKTGDACWLTRAGMSAVLHGRRPCPDDMIPDCCLWSDESRVGLERDNTKRTAREGMLYSNRHIRPLRGVSLGVQIAGLPQGWTPPFGELIPLGGESRLAECQAWNADLALETDMEKIKATGKATVMALSPMELAEEICRGAKPIDDLGGARVVSACLDRPLRIGGWNSLARRPLPLRSVLPSGSVLFCEVDDPERFAESMAAGDELPRMTSGNALARIGSRREWGFGLVAVGSWPDEQEENS